MKFWEREWPFILVMTLLVAGFVWFFATFPMIPPHLDAPQRNTMFRNSLKDGPWSLRFQNEMNAHALVKILRDGECVAEFFMWEGSDRRLKGIPEGEYRVIFTCGYYWDYEKRGFKDWDVAAMEFDSTLVITPERAALGAITAPPGQELKLVLDNRPGSADDSTSGYPIELFVQK